jgi:hypothetical protein
MNVDHYFTIGTDHQAQGRPCEDYALSGTLPGGAVFGVVADGCSGANANTDIGARALAWAFKRTATDAAYQNPAVLFGHFFHGELVEAFARHSYTGSPDDTLATVVGFIATPDQAAVYLQGDGALALRYADGSTRFIEFNWANNKPYYMGYQLRPHLADRYEQEVTAEAGAHPFTQTTLHAPSPSATLTERLPDEPVREEFTLLQVKAGHVLRFNPRAEGIVAMAVMTDGVTQVGALPALQVAQAFTAFKNSQGEFLKRRLIKALKDFKREDAVPRDDVGVAAVWFGSPPAPTTAAPDAAAAAVQAGV